MSHGFELIEVSPEIDRDYDSGKLTNPPIALAIFSDLKLTFGLYDLGDNFYSRAEAVHIKYSHPTTGETISFREPTTREAILALPILYTSHWANSMMNLGRIVKTPHGIFANPPRDMNGKIITDPNVLSKYLDKIPMNEEGDQIVPNPLFGGLKDFGYVHFEEWGLSKPESTEISWGTGKLVRLLTSSQNSSSCLPNPSKMISPRLFHYCCSEPKSNSVLSIVELVFSTYRGEGDSLYLNCNMDEHERDPNSLYPLVLNCPSP